jgi:uncharacterized membrane protein (UPF0127 family)
MSVKALLLAAAASVFALSPNGEPLRARKQTRLTFPDGQMIRVDVVDTPLERERGLMFRRKLPSDYGMLFVFPREERMNFWMKNTWVSLDILFIHDDKTIQRIHKKVKPSTAKTADDEVALAPGQGQYVLELPAGTSARRKLKEGDALKFEVEPAER